MIKKKEYLMREGDKKAENNEVRPATVNWDE